jgi:hypothetical protein
MLGYVTLSLLLTPSDLAKYLFTDTRGTLAREI